MPDDKMMILFSACGRNAYSNTICKFEKLFVSENPDHQKWLKNPVLYKDNIEQYVGIPTHIYLPGDRMPNLTNSLFLNFDIVGRKYPILSKSGVFKMGNIPKINRSVLREAGNPLENCNDFIGEIDGPERYKKKEYREVYKGNVFPIEYQPYDEQKDQRYHLSQVLDKVGPGIYYYMGCRSMQVTSQNEKKYIDTLEYSAQQQRFDTPRRPDKLKRIKALNIKLKAHRSNVDGEDKDDEDDEDEADADADEDDKSKPDPKRDNSPPQPKEKKERREINPLTQLKKDMSSVFLLEDEERMKAAKKKKEEWTRLLADAHVDVDTKTPLAKWCKHALKLIFNQHLDDDNYTTTLTVRKQKGNTHIFTTLTYVDKASKFTVNLQENALLCTIPMDLQSKKYKCESDDIVGKLKSLHKQNPENPIFTMDDFPKSVEDWRKKNVFENICKRLRVLEPLVDNSDSPSHN